MTWKDLIEERNKLVERLNVAHVTLAQASAEQQEKAAAAMAAVRALNEARRAYDAARDALVENMDKSAKEPT